MTDRDRTESLAWADAEAAAFDRFEARLDEVCGAFNRLAAGAYGQIEGGGPGVSASPLGGRDLAPPRELDQGVSDEDQRWQRARWIRPRRRASSAADFPIGKAARPECRAGSCASRLPRDV